MTQNAHPVKSLPASPQKSANGTREGFRENSVCIFVDFENVGALDLAPIENKPVKVYLLLGEQQKNLPVSFVKTLQPFGLQVEIIEAGQGGRNALDMVLCFYLGACCAKSPGSAFYVISKDKDFDPLIKHLKARGIAAARCATLGEVPDLRKKGAPGPDAPKTKTRLDAIPTPAKQPKPAPKPAASPGGVESSDLAARVVLVTKRLRASSKNRPAKRKSLLPHIKSQFGNKVTDPETEHIIDALETSRQIAISPQGAITYLL